mmetsp:Transcript_4550/g.9657  ORF Transcript_4550/g.9657 Transcript_4550/m.9657 type:complete len:200 (-) Transcript_4550:198-797(-)
MHLLFSQAAQKRTTMALLRHSAAHRRNRDHDGWHHHHHRIGTRSCHHPNPSCSVTMNSQIRYGVKWLQDQISTDEDDAVLLTGWTSLSHKSSRSSIPGMIVLSRKQFCFVRSDGLMDHDGEAIQMYPIGVISNVAMTKKAGGLRRAVSSKGRRQRRTVTVSFAVAGKEILCTKLEQDTADKVVYYLTEDDAVHERQDGR